MPYREPDKPPPQPRKKLFRTQNDVVAAMFIAALVLVSALAGFMIRSAIGSATIHEGQNRVCHSLSWGAHWDEDAHACIMHRPMTIGSSGIRREPIK